LKNKRHNHTAQFKAQVAIAAAKGDESTLFFVSTMGRGITISYNYTHPTILTKQKYNGRRFFGTFFGRDGDEL
jgi:hypothetical protein